MVTNTTGLGVVCVTSTTGLTGVSFAMTLDITDASVASSSGLDCPGNNTSGLWTSSGNSDVTGSGLDGVRPGPGNWTCCDVAGPMTPLMTSPVDSQVQWPSQSSHGIQAPPQALHGFTFGFSGLCTSTTAGVLPPGGRAESEAPSTLDESPPQRHGAAAAVA